MAMQLKYSKPIAEDIRRRILSGVSLSVIRDEMLSKYGVGKFPKSYAVMQKLYGDVIAEATGEFHSLVSEEIVRRALEGKSDKLLELLARSKLGWSPNQTNVHVNSDQDSLDAANSALNELATLMGKNPKQEADTDNNKNDQPSL